MTVEQQPAEVTQWVEYTGPEPHGNTFLTSHTITTKDPMWERERVAPPEEDLVWTRDPNGPAVGWPGNRMLLPADDLSDGVVNALLKVQGFQLVE